MDINQICGILSITNAPIICSIPTTYFTQGINGFSQSIYPSIKTNYNNNDDLNDDDDDLNENSDSDSTNNYDHFNEQLLLDVDLDEDKNSKRRVR